MALTNRLGRVLNRNHRPTSDLARLWVDLAPTAEELIDAGFGPLELSDYQERTNLAGRNGLGLKGPRRQQHDELLETAINEAWTLPIVLAKYISSREVHRRAIARLVGIDVTAEELVELEITGMELSFCIEIHRRFLHSDDGAGIAGGQQFLEKLETLLQQYPRPRIRIAGVL